MDKRKYDFNVEAVRGAAALFVVIEHLLIFDKVLDPGYSLLAYHEYFSLGHPRVLLFFVLSGYVIGLAHPNKCNSWSEVGDFAKKRLVRLWPIYLIAILLTLLIVPENDPVKIIGNMFFLQHGFVDTLEGNIALWNLHYEIVYYILFIPLWFVKPNLKWVITGVGLIVGISMLSPFVPVLALLPELFIDYLIGWIFWLSGLLMAWELPQLPEQTLPKKIYTFVFVFFATTLFAPGSLLLGKLSLLDKLPSNLSLSYTDLALVPICVALFAITARRPMPLGKVGEATALLMPVFCIAILVQMERLFTLDRWIEAACLTIIGFLLYFIPVKVNVRKPLAFIGGISYGVYVVDTPIMYAVGHIPFFTGSLVSFTVRAIVVIALVLLVGYVLEKVAQPRIRSYFFKKKRQKELAGS